MNYHMIIKWPASTNKTNGKFALKNLCCLLIISAPWLESSLTYNTTYCTAKHKYLFDV